MKYLKTFEEIDINPDYIIEDTGKYVTIIIDDILTYLDINIIDKVSWFDSSPGEEWNHNNINLINFLKEIFVGKRVKFKSVDKEKGNPYITKKINDVTGTFRYSDYDWYIKVISGKNEYLIDITTINKVYNYDTKNKPLHKEMKIKKDAEKYNI